MSNLRGIPSSFWEAHFRVSHGCPEGSQKRSAIAEQKTRQSREY